MARQDITICRQQELRATYRVWDLLELLPDFIVPPPDEPFHGEERILWVYDPLPLGYLLHHTQNTFAVIVNARENDGQERESAAGGHKPTHENGHMLLHQSTTSHDEVSTGNQHLEGAKEEDTSRFQGGKRHFCAIDGRGGPTN